MRLLPVRHYGPTCGGLARNFVKHEAVFPFYASFKVTSRCHFGCPFCNMRDNRVPDLSTADVKAILDNLSRSPVLMTSFEGGEPLLRDDIEELLVYAREKCGFYLLFTTSVKNITDYPMEKFTRYIDFLHVSIDEGHGNLELFEALPEITRLLTQVSVQTVVTADTIERLEDKVRACHKAGANIVIIPATHMDKTNNVFPDIDALEKMVLTLRKKYPFIIHTPQGYFAALRKGRCSSASIIIAPDGRLFYPCHILGKKGPDLRTTDLTRWLTGEEARLLRREMKNCKRNCGWYQYYSIDSYTSPFSVMEALGPMLFQGKKRK
ncbi:MAG: radical SAM protein [Chitinivibrionales bacterium]